MHSNYEATYTVLFLSQRSQLNAFVIRFGHQLGLIVFWKNEGLVVRNTVLQGIAVGRELPKPGSMRLPFCFFFFVFLTFTSPYRATPHITIISYACNPDLAHSTHKPLNAAPETALWRPRCITCPPRPRKPFLPHSRLTHHAYQEQLGIKGSRQNWKKPLHLVN